VPEEEFNQSRAAQPQMGNKALSNVMDISITFDGAVPQESQPEFTSSAHLIAAVFGRLAGSLGIDHLDVECVLAEDFVRTVNSLMRGFGEGDQQGFTTERIGGVVAAKNLPQVEDQSQVAIVFAPELWAVQGESALVRVGACQCAVPEYGSAVLNSALTGSKPVSRLLSVQLLSSGARSGRRQT
jgi:hypothetical protein